MWYFFLFFSVFSKTFKEARPMQSCLCMFASVLDWWSGWNQGWRKVWYLIFNAQWLLDVLLIFWLGILSFFIFFFVGVVPYPFPLNIPFQRPYPYVLYMYMYVCIMQGPPLPETFVKDSKCCTTDGQCYTGWQWTSYTLCWNT